MPLSDPNVRQIFRSIDTKLDSVSKDQTDIVQRLARMEQLNIDQNEACKDMRHALEKHEARLVILEIQSKAPPWKHLLTVGVVGGAVGFLCSKLNIPLPKGFGG